MTSTVARVRPVVTVAVRSLTLIGVMVALLFIVLPAALAAAATQVPIGA